MKRLLIGLIALAFVATGAPALAAGDKGEDKAAAGAQDKKSADKSADKSGEKTTKKKKEKEGC